MCPSSLRFIAVPGGQATYDALNNGELDVMINRDSRVIAQAKADGLTGFDYVVSSGWLLALNSGAKGSTPPTSDVRVRRAIAAAIDVDTINQRAEDGDGNPTTLAIAPGSLLYQDLPGPAYDPDLAKSLVQEVIAEGNWDGSIRFQCSPDPLQSEQAQAAAAMLEAVGFKVDLTTTATIGDMVTKVVSEGDFDISCWGFNVFDSNVWGGLKGLGSEEASNYYGYNDPNMDAALAELRVAPDRRRREGGPRRSAGGLDRHRAPHRARRGDELRRPRRRRERPRPVGRHDHAVRPDGGSRLIPRSLRVPPIRGGTRSDW